MHRVLITGMSGAGKSSLIRALEARGYRAVDLDSDTWSHWVACEGNPTGAQPDKDWVWRESAVVQLLHDTHSDLLVVSGCAANMGAFLPRFDLVILLSAPPTVLLARLASRSGHTYGKAPEEAAAVLRNVQEVEPKLRAIAGLEIDTDAPRQRVVERVLDAIATLRRDVHEPTPRRNLPA